MKQISRPDRMERGREIRRNREYKDKGIQTTSPIANKGKLRLIKDYFVDYVENTNLHGLKYIGEKKRSPVEKIFWIIMFSCSVVLCAILIYKIGVKWKETPVIVTFAEKSTPVWQIPYPAVTICSEIKVMPSEFNYTKYYRLYKNYDAIENLTEKEKDMFEHASMICDNNEPLAKGRNFSIANIKKMSPNSEDVFLQCKWNQEWHMCDDLFSPTLTEEGVCHTFNTMDPEELFRTENLHNDYEHLIHRNVTQSWSLETGYPSSAPLDAYPFRGSGYGLKAGLGLYLQAFKYDLDYLCSGPIQGFKILLHNPAELPRLSQHYIRLPLSQEILIAVKPKMITTSEGLRPYDSERRLCYFQNQRYLLYFKVYTQNNCQMECFVNFTYERCGCIHFGLPHGSHMKVCDASRISCLKRAQKELLTIEIGSGEEPSADNDSLEEALAIAARCNCLPACTSIDYEAETSQADFDWIDYFKALNIKFSDTAENFQASTASIYFKEPQFITSRRSELYGLTDFLANCGGLLGLFMGFSILSVAEIIYFLTLRLWCRHRRNLTKSATLKSKVKLAAD